ncbi:Rv3235 family protein [Streptomyces cathayae]|uniref:Rv3235 family protein n=1 Tax=Streptomyces cathayae TaxID=3031124 RepID=A0ABY8K4I9_9ACTN|nr:Rv3235 family protein [Streptomyces sp. HUAS 5]WGD42588.1 Rv3235 family protein [Streptomyces sp. HUAS 5]
MNKVMTRARHRTGTRPPGRRDTRRPTGGTVPPRTPAGGTVLAPSPGGGRPSPAPAPASTRPDDNRPPSFTPTARARTRTTATAPASALPRRRPALPAPAPRPAQPRPTDRFAELLLAVLSGQRPVHSMLRHTAGRAYDELADLAERGPLRTRGTRPVVRDIGYYVAREGALEVFARIGAGDRLRAMAFRLEQGQDLRWRCTAVELGGTRPPRPHDH